MNDRSNPQEIPSSATTAAIPMPRPRTVSTVRTPRRTRFRAIRTVKRMTRPDPFPGVRSSGGLSDHHITPPAPDDLIAAVAEDPAADGGDVEVAVAFDQVGERIAQVHHPRDD